MKKFVVALALFCVLTTMIFGGGEAESEANEVPEVHEHEIQIVEEPLVPLAMVDPSLTEIRISVSNGLDFDIGGPVSISNYIDFNDVVPHASISNDSIITLMAPMAGDSDTLLVHENLSVVTQNIMDGEVAKLDPAYAIANKSLKPDDPIKLSTSEDSLVVLNTLFNLDIYGFSGSSDPKGSIDDRVQYDLTGRYYRGIRATNDVAQFTFNADALKESQEEREVFKTIQSRTLNEREILGMYYLEPGNLKDVLPQTILDAVTASGLLLKNELGNWLPIEVLHELGEIYIDQSQRDKTGNVRILIYRWPKDDRVHVG